MFELFKLFVDKDPANKQIRARRNNVDPEQPKKIIAINLKASKFLQNPVNNLNEPIDHQEDNLMAIRGPHNKQHDKVPVAGPKRTKILINPARHLLQNHQRGQ